MARFEPLGKSRLATEVRITQALKAIKERGVQNDYCPRCGKLDWSLDLLDIPANSAMRRPPVAGAGAYVQQSVWQQATGALSLLSIICRNCGYTMFHTLSVLET